MMTSEKYKNLDLYKILGVNVNATSEDIRKAYKKKALECHPDKNPDNPKAAEQFQELTYVLEVLLDECARAEYDKLLKAKEAAKIRHRDLDHKRKKFKEDLEAREQAYQAEKLKQKSEEEKLKYIDELRKENAKLVQEEIRKLQEEIENEFLRMAEDGSLYRIMVEWKADKDDESNGGYNENNLQEIFQKHGDVSALVVSKKKGKALIEFQDKEAAERAMRIESGLEENPLRLKWADKSKRKAGKNSNLMTKATESLVPG